MLLSRSLSKLEKKEDENLQLGNLQNLNRFAKYIIAFSKGDLKPPFEKVGQGRFHSQGVADNGDRACPAQAEKPEPPVLGEGKFYQFQPRKNCARG